MSIRTVTSTIHCWIQLPSVHSIATTIVLKIMHATCSYVNGFSASRPMQRSISIRYRCFTSNNHLHLHLLSFMFDNKCIARYHSSSSMAGALIYMPTTTFHYDAVMFYQLLQFIYLSSITLLQQVYNTYI